MARRDEQDPGFWRRPLSGRSQWVVMGAAAVVVVGAIVAALVWGIRLF